MDEVGDGGAWVDGVGDGDKDGAEDVVRDGGTWLDGVKDGAMVMGSELAQGKNEADKEGKDC